MSLIAAFTIETPLLQEALDTVPEMVLHTETNYMGAEDPAKGLVWAWGDDFDAFERGLAADPTVDEYERVTEVGDRRLYSITYTEAAEGALTYPVLAEYDSTMLDTTGTHEGLEMRVRFPTRDALIAYREACQERGVPFHLHSLYREERMTGDGGPGNPYGLTDPQRNALERAVEMGYFAVPRRTTLEEIADEIGVSTQAVSTRLRRGLENLLQNTVVR